MLGISRDSVEANAAFADKYHFPFPLLSDLTGEACQAYGAYDERNPDHPKRMTFVIGPTGKILKSYEDSSPENQAAQVISLLDRLGKFGVKPGVKGGSRFAQRAETIEEIREDGGKIAMNVEYGASDTAQPSCSTNDAEITGQPLGKDISERMTEHDLVPDVIPSQFRPSQVAGGSTLVFALGKVGYDLASESLRDSLAQHMDGTPDDPKQLLAYLKDNHWDAERIIWTLNLGGTPIYAIRPTGAYAGYGFERLRQFLNEQLTQGVERVSIPGTLAGEVRLSTGQIVPVIAAPELRCMYSWTTAALVEAICGKPPSKSAKEQELEAYARAVAPVTNFLQRVYDELRNLGITSQERAMNYAATNVANARNVFESALEKKLELHSIEVVPSPICRPGSDCWDVKLAFFDPENVLRAKTAYSFTVDVSGVCPVMVDQVRSWSMP